MTAARAPAWDRGQRELVLTDTGWSVLQSLATGSPADGTGLDELGACGFLSDLHKHEPAATELTDALGDPSLVSLRLSYDARAALVAVDYATAALALPAEPDGTRRVLGMHVSLLPAALCRLVDLRPGPDGPRDETVLGPGVGTVRRHWELVSDWHLQDGRRGGSTLGVLDTDRGWWRVTDPQDAHARVRPVTATEVWRAVTALVMRRDVERPPWPRARDGGSGHRAR